MSDKDRREFIKKASILAIGTTILPRLLLADSKGGGTSVNGIVIPSLKDVSVKTEVYGIIDMHSHPSQKLYLLDWRFWKRHYPRKRGDNQFHEQLDTRQLEINGGRVMGMITTHYLPEMSTVVDSSVLDGLYKKLKKLRIRGLAQKIEHENMSNFIQLNAMMDQLELQICIANEKVAKSLNGRKVIVIAKNYTEFTDAIAEGKIPFAHAIEGSHAIGRVEPNQPHKLAAYKARKEADVQKKSPGITSEKLTQIKEEIYAAHLDGLKIKHTKGEVDEQIKKLDPKYKDEDVFPELMRNLELLKKRGICLITLAHFFKNDSVEYPVYGISPDELHAMKMDIKYDPAEEVYCGLTSTGNEIVNKMLQLGILVDLTHSNPTARKDVFELNNKSSNKRPLVFSHTGAQGVFDKYCQKNYSVYNNVSSAGFRDYNVSDKEIMQIHECKGVMGVIPEVFWLTGCDIHCHMGPDKTNTEKLGPLDFHNGVRFMLETIEYISDCIYEANKDRGMKKENSYENIALGTDFDGMADAAKNLSVPSQLGNLTEAMKQQGISHDNIVKITSGNALRVLKEGWT